MSKRIKLFLLLITLFAGLLRIPLLSKFPPALYSDEVSQGYNAYSLLKTGHDEYGTIWPLSFRSFGDWKPPLQTYLMIPTICFFGLNEWGVRLPSAILGTLTIPLIFFLVLELGSVFGTINKASYKIALLSAFFLSISPWHILQSRSAMLVGITLFFFIAGILLFLKGLKKPRLWLVSIVCFSLSLYGYYGMRVVVPLCGLYLLVKFWKQIFSAKKEAIRSLFLGILLLLPLGIAYIKEPNVVFGRAKTVSVFYDKGVSLTVWDLIAQDGPHMPTFWAQFFHNKPYHYTIDIVRRFFQHLNGRFLFLEGDLHPPFQIPGMGVLYFIDGVFLIAGTVFLLKRKKSLFYFLVVIICIAIVPAALTFITPSSNRTFTMVMPFMLVIAYGVYGLLNLLKRRRILFISSGFVIAIFYFLSFIYFLDKFIYVVPAHEDFWHYGYKKLITYLNTQEKSHDQIFISGQASVPYIFLLFYQHIPPEEVNSKIRRNYKDDEFGFEHVDRYGIYYFPRYFKWETDKDILSEGSLLVVTKNEKVGEEAKLVKEIINPYTRVSMPIFRIYTIKKLF